MKLKQLDHHPESRLLVVQPSTRARFRTREGSWESKIGITPAVDGKIIRLPIPERQKNGARTRARSPKWRRKRGCACLCTALGKAKKLKAAGELTGMITRLRTEVQKLTIAPSPSMIISGSYRVEGIIL
jgi:ribosome recycling factor